MFEILTDGCKPTRGSKFSACVDLYASEDVVIGAGETKLVGLGVCIDMDWNYVKREFNNLTTERQDDYKEWFLNSHYMQLMLRSSLGKKGLILPNGVGVIDLDYKDEIKMIIHNPLTFKTASNIAISWANKLISIMTGGMVFKLFEIEKVGFDVKGGFIIKKADIEKEIPATKIGQITLLEHKSYLFGIESDAERSGGFGSTGE